MAPDQPNQPKGYTPPPDPTKEPIPAEKARGARIVLTTPTRKIIFFAGLIGFVLLALFGWAAAATALEEPGAVAEAQVAGGG